MYNVIKNMRKLSTIALTLFAVVGGGLLTSCQDFFETDSDHVIYAEQEHLNNATDSIYSFVGILNKLQAIADRTVLLGEARGDLVDVTGVTSADLRDVATFNVGDDNKYNCPRDYYAIINNCNYFIAKADTALKNNRNEYIFMGEYAAVKAIRAWTYLQLVTTYGKVPFVTTPILTKEESEASYPMYGIQDVCNYFLNEDGLKDLVDVDYPHFGEIKGLPSRLFYIPMDLIIADLYLWSAQTPADAWQAAQYYHHYIGTRNGTNSTYATGLDAVQWSSSSSLQPSYANYVITFQEENRTANAEIITIIPGDSIQSEGYYSELRGIFNSNSDNDLKPSLVPSQSLIDLSAAQTYCLYEGGSYKVMPNTFGDYMSGDLRLWGVWRRTDGAVNSKNEKIQAQTIYKHMTRNIHIYRRQLVYLRMAEALNMAGYPRYAYQILSSGVNDRVLNDSIIPYYTADSLKLTTLAFPNTRYKVYNPESLANDFNVQGIHTRGSGYSPKNPNYQMPYNPEITDSLDQIKWQQAEVEKMIIDEQALELAFEGYRYYDLLRAALRSSDPAFLSKKIKARRGANGNAGISVDLLDQKNWFLHWNGQIGL